MQRRERQRSILQLRINPGISRESALNHTRAKARAKDVKGNATIAEQADIQPANAPRASEMEKEPGAREDTEEPGAKED